MRKAMPNKPKLSEWLARVRMAVAVGKVVAGGKAGGIFDRVEQGVSVADKAKEIADLVKTITKKTK
jgi:hypothetical protein